MSKKIDAVAYALMGAKIEDTAGYEGPDGEIILIGVKIKTLDGHRLLLSRSDRGFKIFRVTDLDAAAKSVFDWVGKGGDAE
ncbi:MAG: hypothetical protein RBT82_12475 [Desulfomonilia bacterium]|jgi:hypothetical protein|nr:hypothetical protein [Desulfomonilia bacterium]